MASGIASVVVAGNITKDAEINSSGRVLSFSVAVNRREKEQGSEEYGEVAHFFDCKVLGNRAQPLESILTRGTKITVHGDLVQERWEAQDGTKRSVVRIIAREIVFGGSPDGKSAPEPKPESDETGW